MGRLIARAAGLAACLTAAAAVGAGDGEAARPRADGGRCEVPGPVRRTPPVVDGRPVQVVLGVTIVDLIRVDDAAQTFTADLVLTVDWRDPRLAAAERGGSLEDCELGPDDIWRPEVRTINRRSLTLIFGPTVTIRADGRVRLETRGLGDFSTRLNLQAFPFDTQRFRVRFASFRHGPQEVRLVGRQVARDAGHDFSLAGWSVVRDYVDADVPPVRIESEEFSRLDFVVVAKRNAPYYLWNFVVPLGFIVLMAWTVFWLDPRAAGTQIGIATASAFTLVAFLVALRGRLPPVPYLTRMDELILCSTVLVFVALAQAIMTSRLVQQENLGLARRLDAYGRWIFLAAFAGVLYVTLLR